MNDGQWDDGREQCYTIRYLKHVKYKLVMDTLYFIRVRQLRTLTAPGTCCMLEMTQSLLRAHRAKTEVGAETDSLGGFPRIKVYKYY